MVDDGQAAVAPAVVAERDGAGAPGMSPGALPGAASPASPAPISDDGHATDGQAVAVALNDTEWPVLGALHAAGAPRTPLAPIAPTRVDPAQAPTAPTRADSAQDQCGGAPVACPFPSCNRSFTDVKALRLHFRDGHNKEGRASRDGLDATLFPAAAFCEECGCGPYVRLGKHTCKEAALSFAGHRRANPRRCGTRPGPACCATQEEEQAGGAVCWPAPPAWRDRRQWCSSGRTGAS